MKTFIIYLVLLILSILKSYGQDFILYGGINSNRFFDYKRNNGQFNSAYSNLSGNNIGIGLDNVKIKNVPFLFTLRTSTYSGNIYNATQALDGSGTTTTLDIHKRIMSLGVYPLTLRVLSNKINLSLGAEYNHIMSASVSGYELSMGGKAGNSYKALNYDAKDIVNPNTFSLASRLAYKVQLKKNIFLMPQYTFSLGLSDEFKTIGHNTKSYRHLFEIGLVKRFQLKERGDKD